MTFFERKRVRDKLQHNQIEPAKEGNAIDITANRRETKEQSDFFLGWNERFELIL